MKVQRLPATRTPAPCRRLVKCDNFAQRAWSDRDIGDDIRVGPDLKHVPVPHRESIRRQHGKEVDRSQYGRISLGAGTGRSVSDAFEFRIEHLYSQLLLFRCAEEVDGLLSFEGDQRVAGVAEIVWSSGECAGGEERAGSKAGRENEERETIDFHLVDSLGVRYRSAAGAALNQFGTRAVHARDEPLVACARFCTPAGPAFEVFASGLELADGTARPASVCGRTRSVEDRGRWLSQSQPLASAPHKATAAFAGDLLTQLEG